MQLRFVVKKVSIPNTKKFEWRVYDKMSGSFPYATKELGTVAQDHPNEPEAQSEADRLTAKFGYKTVPKPARRKASAVGSDDEDDNE